MDVLADVQLRRERFKGGLQWSVTGDEQFRIWILPAKKSEGAQASRQALLRNQTARLEKSPRPFFGGFSASSRKLFQWYSRPIDPDFFRLAAEPDETLLERAGACQDQRDGVKNFAQLCRVIRVVRPQ